jgi:hypothetical protein
MVPDTSLQTLNHLLTALIVNCGVDCKFAINKFKKKLIGYNIGDHIQISSSVNWLLLAELTRINLPGLQAK